MEYSVGDKIIFNKKYIKSCGKGKHTVKEAIGWIEAWLIGKTATITEKIKAEIGNFYWYYIDIPNTHGYDEALFSKLTDTTEALVEL